MNRLLACTLIVGLALALGAACPAWAGDGGHYYPGPYNYGLNYQAVVPESIPYFSQFPPVYYSHPVPRPYGWSPYAYPPGVLTPEPEPVPTVTLNPFVPRGPDSKRLKKPADNVTAQPALRIVNPFVVQTTSPQPSEISQTPQ